MVTPYFSNIENVIIDNINQAKTDIKIAVAWLNNSVIYNILLAKLSNVRVTILLSNDKNNYNNGIDFSNFIDAGGHIYFYTDKILMHNKYLIIDNNTVITGSYNLTYGAEYLNRENIVLFKDETLISTKYTEDFNNLLLSSKMVVDFNSEIDKTEESINNIFKEISIETVLKNENKIKLDEYDKIANTIIDNYNSGSLTDYARGISILLQNEITKTDNQRFLKAAYLIFASADDYVLAEFCLRKIQTNDIDKFKRMIELIIKYKVKVTLE